MIAQRWGEAKGALRGDERYWGVPDRKRLWREHVARLEWYLRREGLWEEGSEMGKGGRRVERAGGREWGNRLGQTWGEEGEGREDEGNYGRGGRRRRKSGGKSESRCMRSVQCTTVHLGVRVVKVKDEASLLDMAPTSEKLAVTVEFNRFFSRRIQGQHT